MVCSSKETANHVRKNCAAQWEDRTAALLLGWTLSLISSLFLSGALRRRIQIPIIINPMVLAAFFDPVVAAQLQEAILFHPFDLVYLEIIIDEVVFC